jgi:hypothetical protein
MGAAVSAELGPSGPSSDEIEAVLQRKEMAAMAGVVQLSPSELLFDACWRGNPGQARREINNGAHVDWCHPNLGNRTALHAAAFAGHVECCEILISAGASILAKDEDGKTAEDWANAIGDDDLMTMLQRWRADLPPSRGGDQVEIENEYKRRQLERGPALVKDRPSFAPRSVGSKLVL